MKLTQIAKSSGKISLVAFILTWLAFWSLALQFAFPAFGSFLHFPLEKIVVPIMVCLSLLGVVLGFHAARSGSKAWLISAVMNALTLLLIVLSPRAKL